MPCPWTPIIIQYALQRLEEEFTADGKANQFATLALFLSTVPQPGEYEAAAAALGVRPALMATLVSRLRGRLRELVRAEIRHTVTTVAEVDEEMHYFVDVLASG